MLTGGILLGVVVASAFEGLRPFGSSTPSPSSPLGSATAPAPSAPTPSPSVAQEPTGTRIRRGTVSFILPHGWFVHRPTAVLMGLGDTFLYLASQPMHDECTTSFSQEGESSICDWPIDALEPNAIFVEWFESSFFDPPLPPGQAIDIGGIPARRGAFDASLCSDIEADGGFRVTFQRAVDRRATITICSRSLTEAGAAQIELFLDSIEWLDEAVDPSMTAQPSSPPSATDMIGEWRLIAGIVDGDEVPVLDRSPTTMAFNGTEMGGSTPCNVYGAEVQVDGDRLSVGMIVQTMIGCSGVFEDAEQLYFAALSKVSTFAFRLDGDQLVLTGPDATLVFRRLV